jgi:glycosyltransferase involved in cell wall biosynthesis
MTIPSIDVSFIIPHKGRETFLKATLRSIAAQDYPLNRVEIIIVTQNESVSADTLAEVDGIGLRVLCQSDALTISALRNVGVDHASGAYLAFLDADIWLDCNWLSSMLTELKSDSNRALVSAIQHCPEDAPILEKIRTALSNAVIDTKVSFLPGRNLLLERSTFNRAGGFPEHLVTCEDYYFTDRVRKFGQLYYSSRSHYIHLGEDKLLKEMFGKEIWRGQSNLQSIRGRRIPISELPSFLVPMWILFFFLAAATCLFATKFLMFLVALGLAFLPVFIYAGRLYRIADGAIGLGPIIRFYSVYFPARIIGTFAGLFKAIKP